MNTVVRVLAATVLVGAFARYLRGRLLMVTVVGHSMEPALHDGDVVLALRGRAHPRRGSVVVGRPPGMPAGNVFVKRVSAVAGDDLPDGGAVPAGHCWVVGDAPDSADSRIWGPVPTVDLLAVVVAPRVRRSPPGGDHVDAAAARHRVQR